MSAPRSGGPGPRRTPPDDLRSARLARIERGIEERLERMARDGELSGLPGEGRPLPDDGGDAAGERWAAFHLMASNKVLPSWAELRREIEEDRRRIARRARAHLERSARSQARLRDLPGELVLEAARRAREHDRAMREEIAAALADLNRKVDQFNAVAPVERLQLPRFTAEGLHEEAATRPSGLER